MSTETQKVEVRLSPTIRNEYDTRDVFGSLPDGPVLSVEASVAQEMLKDAEFNGDSENGPELMPSGTRRAYRSLAGQLSAALARIGGAA